MLQTTKCNKASPSLEATVLACARSTRIMWDKTLSDTFRNADFHHLVGLIVGQRIKFGDARACRFALVAISRILAQQDHNNNNTNNSEPTAMRESNYISPLAVIRAVEVADKSEQQQQKEEEEEGEGENKRSRAKADVVSHSVSATLLSNTTKSVLVDDISIVSLASNIKAAIKPHVAIVRKHLPVAKRNLIRTIANIEIDFRKSDAAYVANQQQLRQKGEAENESKENNGASRRKKLDGDDGDGDAKQDNKEKEVSSSRDNQTKGTDHAFGVNDVRHYGARTQTTTTVISSETNNMDKCHALHGRRQKWNKWFALKGVGEWTKKGLAILCGTDSRVVLFEDLWIQRRLRELFGVRNNKQALDLFRRSWPNDKSLVSYFFWRLRPAAVAKIHSGALLSLTADDFL